MFKEIKKEIKILAKNAVFIVESQLASEKGSVKKAKAIEYIINHLPINEFFKKIVSVLLSDFIDNAVEIAVTYLKSMQNKEG